MYGIWDGMECNVYGMEWNVMYDVMMCFLMMYFRWNVMYDVMMYFG